MIVALSPYSSDIIGLRPWLPIATGSYLDRAEKFPNVAQTNGNVDICYPRSGISGPSSWRAYSCPNLHDSKPLTQDAQLLSY